MSAETIARALGGHRTGAGWKACCPAHEDHDPSLSITAGKDGKVLLKCFAGCAQLQVIDTLQSRGLWERRGRHSGARRFKVKNREGNRLTSLPTVPDLCQIVARNAGSIPGPATALTCYFKQQAWHPKIIVKSQNSCLIGCRFIFAGTIRLRTPIQTHIEYHL